MLRAIINVDPISKVRAKSPFQNVAHHEIASHIKNTETHVETIFNL